MEEKIFAVTEEMISDAKESNKDKPLQLLEFTLDDGRVFEGIFVKPTSAQVERYIAQAQRTAKGHSGSSQAHLQFVSGCNISPDKDKFFEIARDLPLLVTAIADELIQGYGLVSDTKKKIL